MGLCHFVGRSVGDFRFLSIGRMRHGGNGVSSAFQQRLQLFQPVGTVHNIGSISSDISAPLERPRMSILGVLVTFILYRKEDLLISEREGDIGYGTIINVLM